MQISGTGGFFSCLFDWSASRKVCREAENIQRRHDIGGQISCPLFRPASDKHERIQVRILGSGLVDPIQVAQVLLDKGSTYLVVRRAGRDMQQARGVFRLNLSCAVLLVDVIPKQTPFISVRSGRLLWNSALWR